MLNAFLLTNALLSGWDKKENGLDVVSHAQEANMPTQMTNLFIETLLIVFAMGGIIGAAVALSLRPSRYWYEKKEYGNSAEIISFKSPNDMHDKDK